VNSGGDFSSRLRNDHSRAGSVPSVCVTFEHPLCRRYIHYARAEPAIRDQDDSHLRLGESRVQEAVQSLTESCRILDEAFVAASPEEELLNNCVRTGVRGVAQFVPGRSATKRLRLAS